MVFSAIKRGKKMKFPFWDEIESSSLDLNLLKRKKNYAPYMLHVMFGCLIELKIIL